MIRAAIMLFQIIKYGYWSFIFDEKYNENLTIPEK
jgi:hypothetical protein